MEKNCAVYILASRSRVLYVGVTNDLMRRLWEHRTHAVPGFTARYHVTRLVHFEQTTDVHSAITREKEVKAWRRAKKVALIEAGNPTWDDLASEWFDDASVKQEQKQDPSLRFGMTGKWG